MGVPGTPQRRKSSNAVSLNFSAETGIDTTRVVETSAGSVPDQEILETPLTTHADAPDIPVENAADSTNQVETNAGVVSAENAVDMLAPADAGGPRPVSTGVEDVGIVANTAEIAQTEGSD